MHERIISLFAFNFHFNSKFDWSSTNSKTCLKPLAQSKILWNIDIVDTRHLRQNLLLEAKSFFYKKTLQIILLQLSVAKYFTL